MPNCDPPKCWKTKKTGRCLSPNPWIAYLQSGPRPADGRERWITRMAKGYHRNDASVTCNGQQRRLHTGTKEQTRDWLCQNCYGGPAPQRRAGVYELLLTCRKDGQSKLYDRLERALPAKTLYLDAAPLALGRWLHAGFRVMHRPSKKDQDGDLVLVNDVATDATAARARPRRTAIEVIAAAAHTRTFPSDVAQALRNLDEAAARKLLTTVVIWAHDVDRDGFAEDAETYQEEFPFKPPARHALWQKLSTPMRRAIAKAAYLLPAVGLTAPMLKDLSNVPRSASSPHLFRITKAVVGKSKVNRNAKKPVLRLEYSDADGGEAMVELSDNQMVAVCGPQLGGAFPTSYRAYVRDVIKEAIDDGREAWLYFEPVQGRQLPNFALVVQH